MFFHEKRLRLIPLSSDAASNGSRCNTVFYSMDSRFVSVGCSVVGGRSVEEVPRRCRGGNDATTDLRRRVFLKWLDCFFCRLSRFGLSICRGLHGGEEFFLLALPVELFGSTGKEAAALLFRHLLPVAEGGTDVVG